MENENGISQPTQSSRHRVSIAGRRLVTPFLIATAFGFALTLSIALRFQAIMSQLDLVRSIWPAASDELAVRYATANENIVKYDLAKSNDTIAQQWSKQLSAFQELTQYDRQMPHALELENMIRALNRSQDIAEKLQVKDALPSFISIAQLAEAEEKRHDLQSDWLGIITRYALCLKLPPTFIHGA